MGDNEELEILKQKLNESEQRCTALLTAAEEKHNAAEERHNASRQLLADALQALAMRGGGGGDGHVAAAAAAAVVAPNPEETRRERMTKLYTLLQKSQKVKTTKRVPMNHFANGLINI